jgi:hypothetical protein
MMVSMSYLTVRLRLDCMLIEHEAQGHPSKSAAGVPPFG